GVVSNRNGIGGCVGEKPDPQAKHDRDPGFALAQALFHCIGRCCYTPRPPSPLPFPHFSRIPASVAERKFASVPAIIARNPSRARSCLRSGARAPMPPRRNPPEPKFANPQGAKVAIGND